MTFSKAVLSLYIPTDSIPIFRVNIIYFHSLNPTSVLGWFCCYQDLIRPMHSKAIDEKWLQNNKNSPRKLFIGTFQKLLLMTSSRRPGVRLIDLRGSGEKQRLKNTLVRTDSQGGNCLPKMPLFSCQNR